MKTSNANIMNVMRQNSSDVYVDYSSNMINSYMKSNKVAPKINDSSIIQRDEYINTSEIKKEPYNAAEAKKPPAKKISSDKKKRVVNIDRNKVTLAFATFSILNRS